MSDPVNAAPDEPVPVPLPGVPDGLVAVPVRQLRTTDDGERVAVRHRSGRHKLDRVDLVAADPVDEEIARRAVVNVGEAFVLGAGSRAWTTVVERYGERAADVALELARAGVIGLRCTVDRVRVSDPERWELTEIGEHLRDARRARRDEEAERWLRRAAGVAPQVRAESPELAEALTDRVWTTTLPVLVHAAEDLLAGVVHDGPRAFSQAHFGDTKERDDVAAVLRRHGVTGEVLDRLGVRRSPRLGLAGPVTLRSPAGDVDLTALDGPVLVRVDQPKLRVHTTAMTTVVVENLQAAEILADRIPDVAIVYTPGPPADAALAVVEQLGAASERTILVPDADLGGVRIAERLLRIVPEATLIDIGAFPHPPAQPWPPAGISHEGLEAALDGPAAELAGACLERGYPVEQEIATVRAVRDALAAD